MNVLAGCSRRSRGKRLIDHPDRSPQFPAPRREHQDVVHEADVEPPAPRQRVVHLAKEERSENRARRTARRQAAPMRLDHHATLRHPPQVLADQVRHRPVVDVRRQTLQQSRRKRHMSAWEG